MYAYGMVHGEVNHSRSQQVLAGDNHVLNVFARQVYYAIGPGVV